MWSVGKEGWIISSVDTGQTWQTITSDVTVDLFEVSFPSKVNGWVVGDSGVILSYDNPTIVENSSTGELPTGIQILDPYPFNPTTTISFQLPQATFISLKVYDAIGNEVATLINEEKPAGSYKVEFNAEGLTSGIYFYQLKAGDPSTGSGEGFIETKKMILIK